MDHRSPGDGSVYKRKSDGRWVASLTVGGKRRVVYGATRAEAQKKLADLRQQSAGGSLPAPGKRTVADLLDLWLEASAPGWKPRTEASYRWFADTYVLPALGGVRLSRLEPAHVQRLYSDLHEASPSVADRVHRLLHRLFAVATLWRWLPSNPCDRVVRPVYRTERKDVWTREELAAFLEGTADHWLQPLWLVLVASGCRLGEALALTWQDVDLGAGVLSVSKTGQHVRGVWTVTTPKTKAGHRVVSLPAEAVAALRRQRAQQAEWHLRAGSAWQDSELVFTGGNGKPLHASVVSHAMRKECDRLGLPRLSPHGLRHLSASLLLAAGRPLPEVSRRLGHANPGITAGAYAHVVGRGDDEAAAAIGRALAR